MSPFFSVVIPLYNKSSYIEKTLKSVLAQTFTDFEIIIVNDGSTDDSLEKVKQLKNQKITIIDQENKGPSFTRNHGIENANGQYIALLDADDFWETNHLEALNNCISQFPNAVLHCTNYNIKRKDSFITPAVFNFNYNKDCLIIPDFFKSNGINFIPSSSSVAFKKSVYSSLKGYDIKLRTGQDIDLWIQFGLLGKLAFNPEQTMTYNLHDTLSLSNSNYNDDRYNLIAKYKTEEQENASLKHYLDINRYALAIRYKLAGDNNSFKKVKDEIKIKNLNGKQRVLLNLPKGMLLKFKQIQNFLIRKNIYLSAFK